MSIESIRAAPECAKTRRLRRIFNLSSGNAVVLPLDELLISGGREGLGSIHSILDCIRRDAPDAFLGYRGFFQANGGALGGTGRILNLTGSISRGDVNRKVRIFSVTDAIRIDADCVAIHINIGSTFESEMLATAAELISEAGSVNLPVLGIVYDRSDPKPAADRLNDGRNNTVTHTDVESVMHVARVALELGCDLIKTCYPQSEEALIKVVNFCAPVPILLAGGAVRPPRQTAELAATAMNSGAKGIAFGRSVFSQKHPGSMLGVLKEIVHRGKTVDDAMRILETRT